MGCVLYSECSLSGLLGGEVVVERGFSPYFPPLKPRCVLWSSVSYSLKIMVNFFSNEMYK